MSSPAASAPRTSTTIGVVRNTTRLHGMAGVFGEVQPLSADTVLVQIDPWVAQLMPRQFHAAQRIELHTRNVQTVEVPASMGRTIRAQLLYELGMQWMAAYRTTIEARPELHKFAADLETESREFGHRMRETLAMLGAGMYEVPVIVSGQAPHHGSLVDDPDLLVAVLPRVDIDTSRPVRGLGAWPLNGDPAEIDAAVGALTRHAERQAGASSSAPAAPTQAAPAGSLRWLLSTLAKRFGPDAVPRPPWSQFQGVEASARARMYVVATDETMAVQTLPRVLASAQGRQAHMRLDEITSVRDMQLPGLSEADARYEEEGDAPHGGMRPH